MLLIVLLCCCSRIRLAVAVCKCAGQFVARVCGIVLVPIWQTLFVIVLWVAAIIAIIYLASSATFVARQTDGNWDVFTSVSSYTDEKLIYLYYFIFGTLWTNALFQAMGIFVVASACTMWYYAHGPGQELDSPILRSYKMVFRYHLGSLAFGSFILAVVQFLQLVVEAFKKQAEAQGADKNKCFEYVINCIRCCLACVERIVQFINKTAYIQIAIRGKNFCGAAFDGFDLVWSNAMRFAVVGGVGEILMFLGKMIISVLTALAFYALITYVSSIAETIFEPILLIVVMNLLIFRSCSSSVMQFQLCSWQCTVWQWTLYWRALSLTRTTRSQRVERLHCMLLRNWPNSSIGTNDQLNEMYRFFLIACIKTLSFYYICIYDFILNFIDGGKINVSQKIIELRY